MPVSGARSHSLTSDDPPCVGVGALLFRDKRKPTGSIRQVRRRSHGLLPHLCGSYRRVRLLGIPVLGYSPRIKRWPAMAVKLSRIIARADMHTKPPDVLRKYGNEYKIEVGWNGDRMVFEGTVERQWNILRLLDEARTLGPVTGKKWDSSSKTEV